MSTAEIIITARHMEMTPAIKEHFQHKLEKLGRYMDGAVQKIEAIIDYEHHMHRVELKVHISHSNPCIAEQDDNELYAALDIALDKAEQQLRRQKERVRNRKHPPHNEVKKSALEGHPAPGPDGNT